MALAQPTYEELQDELAKLRRLYQGACREARLEQLRADRAESQLEDKSRVKEDAQRAMEKEKMEELEDREKAHQREMEKLRGENDLLRKRLEERDNNQTTKPRLNSSLRPSDTSDPTMPGDLSDNFSTVATFTQQSQKVKKEEPIVPKKDNEDNQNGARDFMDEQLPMDDHEVSNDDVIAEDNDPTVAEMDSINDFGGIEDIDGTSQLGAGENRIESMDPIEGEEEIEATMENATDTPETAKVEKRNRPSRHVSRTVRYNESIDDSDGDIEPSVKKSRSDSTRKADNKRRLSKGDDESKETAINKVRVSKTNDSEMECPECEYHSRSVPAWLAHLKKKHNTSPVLAGLALLCECGDESLSDNHSRTCDRGNNITVIRKRDGPILRFGDAKATPQCVLCAMYPQTSNGYAHHIQRHHNSTLAENGIYLICSCGIEVRSTSGNLKHLEECDLRQFTLHKLDDKKATTPQCLLCEMFPKTVCGYAKHLKRHHKSTLIKNGIYLKCSCGLEVRSYNGHLKHLEECDPRQFTLHKLDDEKATTPQCVLCEMYPKTALGYGLHLERHHKSTLTQTGIYLICSCGIEVRSSTGGLKHYDGCDPRQFTLHKEIDE